jgi:predicted transcriptional regulator of viral defense system
VTVSAYIKHLQAVEEYAFSLEEVTQHSNKSKIALKRELSRLVKKGEVLNLRKGFYLILPPRYALAEKLPVQLYVEKLFKWLDRPYYVGLYSAARLYGASHQQLQQDYILIEPPKLKGIKKQSFALEFLTTSNWPKNNVEEKKSDAGVYKLSSPALTLVDLIHYHTKIGGLNRLLAIVEELSEEISELDIKKLVGWYDNKSTLQRTGWLLEKINGVNAVSETIYSALEQKTCYPILLSPVKNQKPGSANNRWKVDVNLKIETDL